MELSSGPARCGNGASTHRLRSPHSIIGPVVLRVPSRWRSAHLVRRGLLFAFGVALAVVALLWSAKGVSGQNLGQAFQQASWAWILAAVAANALSVVAQGWAWRIGLRAGGVGDVPLRHAVSATWIGKAGNQLLPARVGEIARIAIVRRHVASEPGQLPRIIGSLVAQRAFAAIATFIAVVATTLSFPIPIAIPGGRFAPLAAFGGLIATTVLARRFGLGAHFRRVVPRRLRGLSDGLVSGAALIRPNRTAANALALHLFALVAQLSTMAFLLRAFDISTPITAPLMIVALVALAGAVPGVPGGLGVNQMFIVAPLGASYGVPASSALAFSLGLQATIAVVAIAGGLVALAHQRFASPMTALAGLGISRRRSPWIHRWRSPSNNEGLDDADIGS